MLDSDVRFDIPAEPLPNDVTADNWVEKQAEGFAHLTNMGWPIREDLEDSDFGGAWDWLLGQHAQYGTKDILLGHPFDPKLELPSAKFQSGKLYGVYVRGNPKDHDLLARTPESAAVTVPVPVLVHPRMLFRL